MMNAKCGSCNKTHDTMSEYRNCAGVASEAESAAKVMDEMEGTDRTVNPPSDKQVRYVLDLLAERVWPDALTEQDLRAMERRQISALIVRLRGCPMKVAQHKSDLPEVPAGRYAVLKTHPNPELYGDTLDDWDFFQVDKPTKDKWAGHTFVSRLVGNPGDYRKYPVYKHETKKVLERIAAAGPEKASLNYGKQTKVCGVCNSPLTNQESRDLGIGPKCASKTGWGAVA